MIIIGDPHGHYLTLLALIKKVYESVPKSEQIVIAGDLVDRGPRSYEVVKYVIDDGIQCVQGNHEWAMVKARERIWMARDWHKSGGHATMKSYKGREDELDKHRDFLAALPKYLRFEDQVNDEGRHLLVTHTGMYEKFVHWVNDPESLFQHYKDENGNVTKFHYDNSGVYNVHGHTPVPKPEIERAWANVDTGCFIKFEAGYARLTALRFPQMEIFDQENLD